LLKKIFTQLLLDWTYVHYVKLDRSVTPEQLIFKKNLISGQMMNGINTDGTDIFANDVLARVVKRMRPQPDHSLHLIEEIPTIRLADNIEFDSKTGNFYLGTMAHGLSVMKFNEETKHNMDWKREEVECAGGAVELAKDANGVWVAKEILV
jgi:hypothetical protein